MEETQQPDAESPIRGKKGGRPGWWHGLDLKYRIPIIVALIGLCGTLAAPVVDRLAEKLWQPTPTPTPTPTPQVVALKTYHNRYVSAMGEDWDWILRAGREEWYGVDSFERFTLLCLENGKIALKTYHNRYVSAMGEDWGWILRAETGDRLAYEEFTVVEPDTWEQLPCQEVEQLPCQEMFKRLEAGEVKIALKTCHNRYVTAMGEDRDWIVVAEREESAGVDLFEGFTVIPQ